MTEAVVDRTREALVDAVERAMAASGIALGDTAAVAPGLWAHVHGLASLTAAAGQTDGPQKLAGCDWSRIADASLAAHVLGLADDHR